MKEVEAVERIWCLNFKVNESRQGGMNVKNSCDSDLFKVLLTWVFEMHIYLLFLLVPLCWSIGRQIITRFGNDALNLSIAFHKSLPFSMDGRAMRVRFIEAVFFFVNYYCSVCETFLGKKGIKELRGKIRRDYNFGASKG